MDKEKEVGNPNPIKIGITIGDINGIGPEVIIKSLNDNRILLDCTPVIYGSTKVFSFYKKLLNEVEFNYQTIKDANEIQPRKINIINTWNEDVEITPGTPSEASGKYAIQSLEKAAQDLASGKIDVLVTAPFSKEAVAKSGFSFIGHTEYLAEMSGVPEALMILVSNSLRVALVTVHVPLKEVAGLLTKDKIMKKISAFEDSLKKDFALVKPRIAVLGLNPHAGENGKLGQEEKEIIAPAIQASKAEGKLVFGPYAADGFFGSQARNQFDGVLAMYHDQGLAAFKAIAFEDGVNFTAGLPIVRTSPDHGTAYDIAGKNEADASSFRSAIYLATDIFKNRKFVKEINSNPLPIGKHEGDRSERDN
jgi:4-hydroxythreonine-4-phosphate dehydrogenase